MKGPVNSILVKNKNIYHSMLNSVYKNGEEFFKTKFNIHGIRVYDGNFLVYGGLYLAIFNSEGLEIHKTKFNSWILDVLYTDTVIIGTCDGQLLNLEGEITKKLDHKNVLSMKILNCNVAISGTIEDVLYGGESIKLHSGRIFSVSLSEYGFTSSGEDRKTHIYDRKGYWCIQDLRSYAIISGIYKNIFYMAGRDGLFRIFIDRKLVYSESFGILGIRSCFLDDDVVYLGLSNGEIINLKINELKNQKIGSEANGNFVIVLDKESEYTIYSNIINPDYKLTINDGLFSLLNSQCKLAHKDQEMDEKFAIRVEYQNLFNNIEFKQKHTLQKIYSNVHLVDRITLTAYIDTSLTLHFKHREIKVPFKPLSILTEDERVYVQSSNSLLIFAENLSDSHNFTVESMNFQIQVSEVSFDGKENYKIIKTNLEIKKINLSGSYIKILHNTGVLFLDNIDFKPVKNYQMTKPVDLSENFILTKNGWVINEDFGFKIDDKRVFSIHETKEFVVVLSLNAVYIIEKKRINYCRKYIDNTSCCCTLQFIGTGISKKINLLKNTDTLMYMYKPVMIKKPYIFYDGVLFEYIDGLSIGKNGIFLKRNHELFYMGLNFCKSSKDIFFTRSKNTLLSENEDEKVIEFRRRPTSLHGSFKRGIKYREWFLLGTEDQKVVLMNSNMTVDDVLGVNGTVTDLICISKKAAHQSTELKCKIERSGACYYSSDTCILNPCMIVATGSGLLYVISIHKSKLFINSRFELNFKAVSIFFDNFIYVSDSSGNINVLRLIFSSLEKIHMMNLNTVPMMIKSTNNLLVIASTNGCIYYIPHFSSSFLPTQNNHGTNWDNNLRQIKIHQNIVNCLITTDQKVVTVSDDHRIAMLGINTFDVGKSLVHSSTIIWVLFYSGFYYTVSNDKLIKKINQDLVVVDERRIYLNAPAFMLIDKSTIFIFGEGVETLDVF